MGKKDPLQALVNNGGGTVRKLVGIAAALAVAVIVVKYPNDAADMVTWLVGAGTDIVNGLVTFIRQVS
ncbi:hypothetical protein SacmaDRAFT_0630 [Saccharomonospora marina XMU15]|uniref:Uncharacterized protein n=1 Tax=Saccharomonospora marina XMU15 TaxID=882083 RepID=H5X5B9_9PSEU|nr:hypothetical protein [Saccharomonospora marina]EHR48930.1 hypothetical protein SacmaDRAFT_0630 [Saccharomonospora marina XMU15]